MSIHSISQAIDRALTAAGLNTKTGTLKTVATTIEKALASAGLGQWRRPKPEDVPPAFRAPQPTDADASSQGTPATAFDAGQFLSLSHVNGQISRTYKLYVPSSVRGEPAPLIVMLHGCKQNPDDFAAGTRMNQLAEREGFLVAYPEQTARENGSNCWNWFDRSQQTRGGIEPSFIAGIVQDIAKSHAVDSSRVFVAGLSAGAAMAVILGATYPEIFAGVAAHSGLPAGAAHDVTSAFAAMQGRPTSSSSEIPKTAVPTIVIHGDADYTVSLSNGGTIVEHALQGYAASDTTLHKSQRPPVAIDGKKFTTIDYTDAGGKHRIEEWVVHGGSHAWFGGSPEGSYTDAAGPDASAEIVRFFLSQKS